MSTIEYKYPAYLVEQTTTSKPLVLFGARANEIGQWVGIPQRERLDGGETVGFQREENSRRVDELSSFFSDPRNVVQNALLCATQSSSTVTFTRGEGDSPFGTLVITSEDLESLPLRALILRLISQLESRVPSLAQHVVDADRQAEVLRLASEIHPALDEDLVDEPEEGPDDETASEAIDSGEEIGEVLFTDETQLVDFYQELKVRAEVLDRLGDDTGITELLGFSKEAMLSYLRPVVLVDGQHRLRGAIRAAKSAADSADGRESIRDAIKAGVNADTADSDEIAKYSRILPVSLLLDDSPSEHVFQFVVVNQKATPMGKALLGTIVSTSLSLEELRPVAERLTNAGIQLEDSRAVAYLSRATESPFKGLVQTGVQGDSRTHLQWPVLKGLAGIFRELKGGKLYHQTVDYADLWKRKYLQGSDLVSSGADEAERFEIWSAQDGVWRDVFIRFFLLVRNRFGDVDLNASNAWGNTAGNLFNKVSLTILAADYFQYLCDSKSPLNSIDDVDSTFAEWLDGINDGYFARDWKLPTGLKKDLPAVRSRWAETWLEYRKDPTRLPNIQNFRPK